jgi:hypothetical protein
MRPCDSMTLTECLTAITQMVEPCPKIASIQHSLRLSRLKIGSAIEQMDTLATPTVSVSRRFVATRMTSPRRAEHSVARPIHAVSAPIQDTIEQQTDELRQLWEHAQRITCEIDALIEAIRI